MTTPSIPTPAAIDNTAEEEWRAVEGYEGRYEVSNLGRVKSLTRRVPFKGSTMFVAGCPLELIGTADTGLRVNLHKHGQKRRLALVHVLVARAFVPNPSKLPVVNHIDFDRTNNVPANLEWGTQRHNIHHSMRAGRMAKKLSDAAIAEILRRLATGESQQSIGDRFGVSQAHVSRIKLGLTWERFTR